MWSYRYIVIYSHRLLPLLSHLHWSTQTNSVISWDLIPAYLSHGLSGQQWAFDHAGHAGSCIQHQSFVFLILSLSCMLELLNFACFGIKQRITNTHQFQVFLWCNEVFGCVIVDPGKISYGPLHLEGCRTPPSRMLYDLIYFPFGIKSVNYT